MADPFREPLRVVFLGTPDFAVPSLAALLDAGVSVPPVVTQPDRPVGRHAEPRPSAVAAFAAERAIPIEKPEAVRGNEALAERIAAERPDALAVVAYGRILPPGLLALPRLAPVNVHASLLPRHRGASPIQAAILAGDAETGVATMRMAEALDAGPVYLERRVPIGPRETAGELSARLATMGAALLADTLAQVEAGSASRTPQPSEGATVTKKIRKDDGRLDFTQPAQRVHDRARAMTPWPGALASFAGETLRFARTRIAEGTGAPGAVLSTAPLIVACGEGALEVVRVVPAGKAEMDAPDWWRGLRASKDETRFTTPHREELS